MEVVSAAGVCLQVVLFFLIVVVIAQLEYSLCYEERKGGCVCCFYLHILGGKGQAVPHSVSIQHKKVSGNLLELIESLQMVLQILGIEKENRVEEMLKEKKKKLILRYAFLVFL